MAYRTLLLFLLTALAHLPVEAGVVDTLKRTFGNGGGAKRKEIKVLIGRNLDGAMVEVTGAHNLFDPRNGKRLGTRFVGKSMYMQPIANGLRWGEEFPGTYQLTIVPDHPNTSVLVNGLQYHGVVAVFVVEGHMQIVNVVDVEDYLTSVLSTQLDQAMDQEVMNALAIAARTTAYYQVDRSTNRYYDVVASDVGYQGHVVFSLFDGVRAAVASTDGIVLRHPHSKLESGRFTATWTANSAGRTAPYHLIYHRDAGAPLKGVKAPFAERARPATEWRSQVALMELAQLGDVVNVRNVHLLTDKESGKVYRIRLEGSGGTKDMDFHEFQEALGPQRLRSAEFTASVVGDNVFLRGVGEGDGVGVCLFEAEKMAQNGQTADNILEHFFPGAQIEFVRPEVMPKRTAQYRRPRSRNQHIR